MNAIWELAGLTLLGWIVYRRSYLAGHMIPSDKDARELMQRTGDPDPEYESFSPFIYSLENSIPLVKLGQADAWRPIAHRTSVDIPYSAGIQPKEASGENALVQLRKWLRVHPLTRLAAPPWVRYFLWFQILLGWVLATLFVAGFSGLIKGK